MPGRIVSPASKGITLIYSDLLVGAGPAVSTLAAFLLVHVAALLSAGFFIMA